MSPQAFGFVGVTHLSQPYDAALTVTWFVFGAVVGSALNQLNYRLPLIREQSNQRRLTGSLAPGQHPLHLLSPRPFCERCRTPLKAWQLLPIAGWVIAGGRCPACRTPIALEHPIFELFCALVFLFNPSDCLPGVNLYLKIAGLVAIGVGLGLLCDAVDHWRMRQTRSR